MKPKSIEDTEPKRAAELYKKSEATKNESLSGKDKLPENTDEISIDGGTRASRWEKLREYLKLVVKVADENSDKLAVMGSEAEDVRNANLKLTDVIQTLIDLAGVECQREKSLELNDVGDGVVVDTQPQIVKFKEYSAGGVKRQPKESPKGTSAELEKEASFKNTASEKSASRTTNEEVATNAPDTTSALGADSASGVSNETNDANQTNAPESSDAPNVHNKADEDTALCTTNTSNTPNTYTIDEILNVIKDVRGMGSKTKTYQKIEKHLKDQEKKGVQTSLDFGSEAQINNVEDSSCETSKANETNEASEATNAANTSEAYETSKSTKVKESTRVNKANETNEAAKPANATSTAKAGEENE